MGQDFVLSFYRQLYYLSSFIVKSPVTKLGLITNKGSKVSRGKIYFARFCLSQRAEKLFMAHFYYCLSLWPFFFFLFVCTVFVLLFVCLRSFLNLTQSMSFRLRDLAMIEYFSYPCLQLKVSSGGSHTFLGNCPPTLP